MQEVLLARQLPPLGRRRCPTGAETSAFRSRGSSGCLSSRRQEHAVGHQDVKTPHQSTQADVQTPHLMSPARQTAGWCSTLPCHQATRVREHVQKRATPWGIATGLVWLCNQHTGRGRRPVPRRSASSRAQRWRARRACRATGSPPGAAPPPPPPPSWPPPGQSPVPLPQWPAHVAGLSAECDMQAM